MINGCHIRPFEPHDLPALHAIREAAFKPVFRSFRNIVGDRIASCAFAAADREQAGLLDRVCEKGSPQEVFVAEWESDVVAFCAISLDRQSKLGEIELNAVHPDFQGKGIGTEMYEFALDRMRAAGMKVATVGTGGDPSHAPTRRALQKAGFGPAIPGVYFYRSL